MWLRPNISLASHSKVVTLTGIGGVKSIAPRDALVTVSDGQLHILEIELAYIDVDNSLKITLAETWTGRAINTVKSLIMPISGEFQEAASAIRKAISVIPNADWLADWMTIQQDSLVVPDLQGIDTTINTLFFFQKGILVDAQSAVNSAASASESARQTALDVVATAAHRVKTASDTMATRGNKVAAALSEIHAESWASADTSPVYIGAAEGSKSAKAHASEANTHANNASTSETNASHDAAQVVLDKQVTAADRMQTGLDKTAIAADRVQTGLAKTATTRSESHAATSAVTSATEAGKAKISADKAALDRIATADDRVATDANVVKTNADVTTSGMNATQAQTSTMHSQSWAGSTLSPVFTGAPAGSRSAKVYAHATAADKKATAADSVQTGLDKAGTKADKAATNAAVRLTNADVVATGADKVQTGLDRIATALDKTSTNADVLSTAADRVKTGRDKMATAQSASDALAAQLVAESAAGALTGSMAMFGDYDASTNLPPPTPIKGAVFYKITVSGTIDGIEYGVGDSIVYNHVGAQWFKLDNTESVTSVNGKQGIVNLVIADISLLQTALDEKVDDSRVLTNVPSGAVFTDTLYSVQDGGLSACNFTLPLKNKLNSIADNANNYHHPTQHPASIITQDANHRYVSDIDMANWNAKPSTDTTYSKLSAFANDVGFITSFTDTVYTHPVTAGNKHIPAGGAIGQILKNTASGTATWQNEVVNTTYHVGNGGLSEINFTPTKETKLKHIANNANNYTHPNRHAISVITGLQSALDSKADSAALDSLQKQVNTMNILNILGF